MKATDIILSEVFGGGSGGGGGGGTLADQIYPFGATITFDVSGVPSGQWMTFCNGDTSGGYPIYSYDGEYYGLLYDVSLTNGETELFILSAERDAAYLSFGETLPSWTMTLDDNAEVVDDEGLYSLRVTGGTTIGLVPT